MAKIQLPALLKQFTEQKEQLIFSGETLEQVLQALTHSYPKLKQYIFDGEGKLCSFINIYLNDEDVRFLEEEKTAVADRDSITIITALAGG